MVLRRCRSSSGSRSSQSTSLSTQRLMSGSSGLHSSSHHGLATIGLLEVGRIDLTCLRAESSLANSLRELCLILSEGVKRDQTEGLVLIVVVDKFNSKEGSGTCDTVFEFCTGEEGLGAGRGGRGEWFVGRGSGGGGMTLLVRRSSASSSRS